jgi:O-acetyl-ADP-ribose deacetylase (regulator of RNase III)
MDVGKGMMFSANVVDGLVHQLGGKALAQELQSHGSDGNEIIVNEGQAVWTSGVGDYSYLVHTVPPFFDNNDAKQANRLLQDCYHNSLQLASSKLQETTKDTIRIASPLLGAGCRGFPLEDAVDHCVQALCDFQSDQKLTLAFGIPTEQVRNILLESLRDSDFVPVSTDGTQL